PIPVRPGDATIARYRRIAARGVVLAVLAIVAALLAAIVAGPLALVALAPPVMAVIVVAPARTSARRLIRQRVAASFSRPSWGVDETPAARLAPMRMLALLVVAACSGGSKKPADSTPPPTSSLLDCAKVADHVATTVAKDKPRPGATHATVK